ncbi:FAD-dependent oxidoreductase [Actinophytocola sp.]|uniref:FAD-dependent oxidoreductase n=1 Tax=Actinophytocola sp. TaxID=1872138 RepID=UPI003D6B4605
MTTTSSVLIVGASTAGWRTATALRAAGYDGSIVVVGDEPHLPYDRPCLSKQLLLGTWPVERAYLTTATEVRDLAVDLRLGVAVRAVGAGHAELTDGSTVSFEHLVVATGVRPRLPPGWAAGRAMHVLRRIGDSVTLRRSLAGASNVLVVGGGFIGTEVAAAARRLGLETTILLQEDVLLELALGPAAGGAVTESHRANGVKVLPGAMIGTILTASDDEVVVELADGARLESDCAVFGLGSLPNVEWLAGCLPGDLSGGLPCDGSGRVIGSPFPMHAVGDVASWPDEHFGGHVRHEHWTSAGEQARVVAATLTGATRPPRSLPYFWSDQFNKIQLVGRPDLATSVVRIDTAGGGRPGAIFAYYRGTTLVAAAAIDAPRALAAVRRVVSHDTGDRDLARLVGSVG